MRIVLVVLTCCLQGCFFYVPGGLFASGNSCAPENISVGQRFTNTQNGKQGVVKEIIGRSDRCQKGTIPILVTVEYE